jgi:hypothetical protein
LGRGRGRVRSEPSDKDQPQNRESHNFGNRMSSVRTEPKGIRHVAVLQNEKSQPTTLRSLALASHQVTPGTNATSRTVPKRPGIPGSAGVALAQTQCPASTSWQWTLDGRDECRPAFSHHARAHHEIVGSLRRLHAAHLLPKVQTRTHYRSTRTRQTSGMGNCPGHCGGAHALLQVPCAWRV